MLPAFLSLLAMAFAFSPTLAGQQHPPRASSVPDLFNQEAGASDPAGILKYSKGLIGLVVPEYTGESFINSLADRLARAEQMAREGRGKLVPEQDVVQAFNELMQQVGAPSSLRTDEASMRRFREHAASIKAFPALFTAARNGTNCNPGEAVFLLYVLVSENGKLSEEFLDSALLLTQLDNQRSAGGGRSFGIARMEALDSSVSVLLSSYASHRNRSEVTALYKNLAALLGF
uniref:Uncharacterized protein n=1 Tax=mine drainage metagenome TaxID=410659 RepID=E6QKB9_9ZZZZ